MANADKVQTISRSTDVQGDVPKEQTRSTIFAAGIGLLFDGYAVNVYALTLVTVAASFAVATSRFTIVATLFLAGYAVGSAFFGNLADWIGRRRALGASIAGYGIVTALTGLAGSIPVMGALRFLTGVGGGGELTVGAPFSNEALSPRRRALGIGVFLAFYPLGILLSIGVIKAMDAASVSWRFDYLFAIVPAILILMFRLKVKESQRYTTVKEIRARENRSQVTLLQAARDPRIVGRILIAGALVIMPLYYSFYVNTLYGEAFWVKTLHNPLNTYLNWEILINGIWILASILSGLFADKIGYRYVGAVMYLLGFLGYGLAYSGLLGTGTGQWILGEVIAVIGLGGAWSIANAHVSSLFPTEVRSAGFGWSSGVARVITIACPTITTALISAVGIHGGLDSAPLICVIGIVGFVLARELKGTVLTDFVRLPRTHQPQPVGVILDPNG